MIPIIINNFNRLTTTKKLVEDLNRLGYIDITILDNQSTYPELLEWYKTDPCKIVYLDKNYGARALWESGYINKLKNNEWIAYTDSDIILNKNIPNLFIGHLIQIAIYNNSDKVGLALRIDDLPDTKYANLYKVWEGQFWVKEINQGFLEFPNIYEAEIDTTFCVIKPNGPFIYKALRVAGEYTCKHYTWYVDFNNLDKEEQYYLDHSTDWSTYKTFYNSQKTK